MERLAGGWTAHNRQQTDAKLFGALGMDKFDEDEGQDDLRQSREVTYNGMKHGLVSGIYDQSDSRNTCPGSTKSGLLRSLFKRSNSDKGVPVRAAMALSVSRACTR